MTSASTGETLVLTSRRVPWAAVAAFIVLSFGLAWLIALPLWLGGGLGDPLSVLVTSLIMLAPATAAVVVLLVTRTPKPVSWLGLSPRGRWRPILRFGLLGALGAVGVSVAALLLASAAGLVDIALPPDWWMSVALIVPLAVLIGVLAVGEEIGWRGFLQPALSPLGVWPALIITGIAWGLWHAPLVLLGYNYGSTDPLVLAPMVVTTVLIGIVIGWMRMRTGSVYPGAFAHGALNASASLVPLALTTTGVIDTSATVLGWTGWLAVAVVIATIVAARQLTWSEQPRPLGSTRVERSTVEK